MKYSEIINETRENNLSGLLNFMIDIKNGNKSDDIETAQPRMKTSYRLNIVSDKIEYGWLVHFTENSENIIRNGFYGVDDFRLLGHTRGRENNGRSANGFNYAFPLPSKEASYEQSRKESSITSPYGTHAIVFKAPYILVYEKFDKQQQAIFSAKDFNSKNCILLSSEQNNDQFDARCILNKYENHPMFRYVNGQRQEVPPLPNMSPEKIKNLVALSKQPAIIWKIENGKNSGSKGGWAKITKIVLSDGNEKS